MIDSFLSYCASRLLPACSLAILLVAPVATVVVVAADAAPPAPNWPHWRGPAGNGSTDAGHYPLRWDADTNVLWKSPLPGKGCSTPIVWDRRIYLTAPVDAQDALLAIDWNGKPCWQAALGAQRTGKHRNGSGCNPSPITDGSAVFVYFKSKTLAAVELDGRVRWKTNLQERFGGQDTLYWDVGTSPVLTSKDVIVAVLHHGGSYVAAFDKVSGDLHWKVARDYDTAIEGDHSYATPLVFTQGGRELLLVWGGEHLTAHDATDGHELWSCGDFNPARTKNWPAVASPVLAGDLAIISFARGTVVHGIKLTGASGDVTATHRLWKREGTGSFVPTPAEYHGKIYILRDRGDIDCLDPLTGNTLWTGELPKTSANYYSSPTIADGKLYAAREDGVIFVARIEGGPFEVLAKNDMSQRIIAAPVPIENRLLLRGATDLFCIGTR